MKKNVPTSTAIKHKLSEEKKPSHSYIRFGAAWQCEECKEMFSRKSYAIEHMQEENGIN